MATRTIPFAPPPRAVVRVQAQVVNEFRLGYNRINTHRFQLNYDTNVSANLGFPGVPFGPNIGGLPQISIAGWYFRRAAAMAARLWIELDSPS